MTESKGGDEAPELHSTEHKWFGWLASRLKTSAIVAYPLALVSVFFTLPSTDNGRAMFVSLFCLGVFTLWAAWWIVIAVFLVVLEGLSRLFAFFVTFMGWGKKRGKRRLKR
jgi:hypothetical protein